MTIENKQTKLIIGIIAGIIVSVIAVMSIPSVTANNPFSQTGGDFSGGISAHRPDDITDFYNEGGKAWVTLNISSEKEPLIEQGKTIQRTMTVNFPSNAYSYEYVTIRFSNNMPYVYPPSVGLTHTAEEIVQAEHEGKPFKRYNTSEFVSIEPSEFVLRKGESKDVNLTVTIPQNVVDEFSGTYIPISPKYEVIPPSEQMDSTVLVHQEPDGIFLKINPGKVN